MNISKLKKSVVAAFVAVALTCSSHAILITPGDALTSGPETGQAAIDAVIASWIGSATELYKSDVVDGSASGVESGLASSYETTFLQFDDAVQLKDPSGADIENTGTPIIAGPAYLLVKDGMQDPGWYLFDLTLLGWTGVETLMLRDFWPNRGSISHVTLYGSEGSDIPGVPDGGSVLALLGLAFGAMFVAKRKLRL
jgi:hypothetical protein